MESHDCELPDEYRLPCNAVCDCISYTAALLEVRKYRQDSSWSFALSTPLRNLVHSLKAAKQQLQPVFWSLVALHGTPPRPGACYHEAGVILGENLLSRIVSAVPDLGILEEVAAGHPASRWDAMTEQGRHNFIDGAIKERWDEVRRAIQGVPDFEVENLLAQVKSEAARAAYGARPTPIVQGFAQKPVEPVAEDSDVRHSDGFLYVYWFGAEFNFTKTQGACVAILWDAWQNKTPVVSEETILERAGSSGSRLRDLFKKEGMHPAWGTMIVSAGKGRFRLKEPEKSRFPASPQENPA